MENSHDTWIKRYERVEIVDPVAIVGSSGLRSVGKLVVESIIAETGARLIAELFSTHLPSVYETSPSYATNPLLPGFAGVLVKSAEADLPKIQFYACSKPELVLVVGYHPNFKGQYEVAEKVVDFLSESHVKRMIVAAGYGSNTKSVVCAANNPEIISEMKEKFNIETGYEGPFMGFSGLVFGLAQRKKIEALCLFASTRPTENDLEFPDNEASERILEKLRKMINLKQN